MNTEFPQPGPCDGSVILGVLDRLARRLWAMASLRECAFAASIMLFAALCLELAAPDSRAMFRAALLAACVIVVIATAFRIAHRTSTREAAAEADARGNLNDELKSAHWFLSSGECSPIEQLQLRRAADTAMRLDIAELVPATWPGAAWPAAIAALLLIAAIAMAPQSSRARDHDSEVPSAVHDSPQDMRSLLAGAPESADVARLDLALREIQRSDIPRGEKMRAIAEARDAIDQASMETSAARDALAALAETLKDDPKFESVARAMREERFEDAKAMLREMKSQAQAATDASPQQTADKAPVSDAAARLALDAAGRDLPGKHAAVNQDAMNRVIKALEQAQERIEVQNRVNAVKRRMDDNLLPANQRSQLTASQFDNRTTQANPTPGPETGNLDVRVGTLFRQAAVARDEKEDTRDGSQTGDASGDSVAQPLEGAATGRLGAKLRLETILQKREEGEQPDGKGDAGWFYSASREQKSALMPVDVQPASSYKRDVATDHDRVPMSQRTAVKDYFMNLHESEKK